MTELQGRVIQEFESTAAKVYSISLLSGGVSNNTHQRSLSVICVQIYVCTVAQSFSANLQRGITLGRKARAWSGVKCLTLPSKTSCYDKNCKVRLIRDVSFGLCYFNQSISLRHQKTESWIKGMKHLFYVLLLYKYRNIYWSKMWTILCVNELTFAYIYTYFS